jgi:hypothetical protein
LRRIIIIGVALTALVGAAVAFAAVNSYTSSFTFSGKTGTKKKPAPIGYTQTLSAANNTAGSRAAPLVDIKTTIYGLISNGKRFPTCSATQIGNAKDDTSCPKKALVAQGPVNAILGTGTTLAGSGTPCNPYLDVWNGGNNTVVYFFKIIPPNYTCATLQNGASAPYIGHISQQGKNMVQDVPLPPDVSTQAGNLSGVYGSLIKEKLTWSKLTTKVKGKTVGYTESIGCKGGKRPWSVQFTAVTSPSTQQPPTKETETVTGSNSC